ncbi:ankyrin repeat and zinc finger domain-containing protein 1-like [Tropilaelaps mercedesae]|uniref:Ankyrin repeat and zinc finger domain-containing protein 1-like n=1 Tax=Tropilaelaps mercedesae TaxID=418985 RepID=A0A1V9X5J5_9ACAR|nr:ankyrin repeat and zinc finger domain-containing protein 1-like [Tropilaelaps mercedesae]
MNSQGSVVEINRILLTTKNESVTSTELLARVESLKDLWLGLIIISGGHFAAAVYHSGKMIRHKTFHQYTVRKKQGGAQSHFDSKSGAAKSAGASLRRYNEKTLMEKSHAILKTWSELDRCSVILFRALGADNRSILFGGSDPVFRKGDIRLRTIPMVTRRPTVKELDRIYGVLTTVKVVHNPSSYYKTKNVTLTIGKSGVKSSKQVTSKKSSEIFEEDNGLNDSRPRRERSKIVPTPAKELIEDVFTTCRDDDVDELKAIVSKTDSHCLKQALTSSLDDHGNTVLHFCCRRGRLAILETILALGADPTMTNNDGQAPYVVATSDKVREVLISFRLANPEMWDFDKASIPDKLPQAKKTSGTCAKSAKENTQMVKNTRRVIEKKSCNSFKKVIDRITSCHLCNKQFHTVPLEADGKPFCSINCVRAWRYS